MNALLPAARPTVAPRRADVRSESPLFFHIKPVLPVAVDVEKKAVEQEFLPRWWPGDGKLTSR